MRGAGIKRRGQDKQAAKCKADAPGQLSLLRSPAWPIDMDSQHYEAVPYCFIVQASESLIASPVHSSRLGRKVIEDVLSATKAFPNFARLQYGSVSRSGLPRGVG